MARIEREPQYHRYTVAAYHRMREFGILAPDERLQLVDGAIFELEPISSSHAGTVDHLAQLLRLAADNPAIVRVQLPISLDDYNEPVPDIALLYRRDDDYKSHHPRLSDVLLVVEVADTSLRFDRDVKAPLYARSGIAEVWLVDLPDRRLIRYREPPQGSYRRVDQPDLNLRLEIEALPGAHIDLDTLFTQSSSDE